jgi:hypothetical protein
METNERLIIANRMHGGELGDFTGGKKIIFTVSYDDISDFWIGKIGTCVSVEDSTGKHYRINDNIFPVPGNINHNIKRYFGWRGTTNNRAVYAHGVRMVEKIIRFKKHARIALSKYDTRYTD